MNQREQWRPSQRKRPEEQLGGAIAERNISQQKTYLMVLEVRLSIRYLCNNASLDVDAKRRSSAHQKSGLSHLSLQQ